MADIKTDLKKKNGWACTGFSGFAQALFNMVMNFSVPQNEEIPWLAEELSASQQGHCT